MINQVIQVDWGPSTIFFLSTTCEIGENSLLCCSWTWFFGFLIDPLPQAENESLCLGLSFAAIRSISFFAIGAMPDTHFHVYGEVENADWHRGWMVPRFVTGWCHMAGLGLHYQLLWSYEFCIWFRWNCHLAKWFASRAHQTRKFCFGIFPLLHSTRPRCLLQCPCAAWCLAFWPSSWRNRCLADMDMVMPTRMSMGSVMRKWHMTNLNLAAIPSGKLI